MLNFLDNSDGKQENYTFSKFENVRGQVAECGHTFKPRRLSARLSGDVFRLWCRSTPGSARRRLAPIGTLLGDTGPQSRRSGWMATEQSLCGWPDLLIEYIDRSLYLNAQRARPISTDSRVSTRIILHAYIFTQSDHFGRKRTNHQSDTSTSDDWEMLFT